jgi:uncharacterized protein
MTNLGPDVLTLIVVATLVAAIIHSVAGLGGGILMVAVLTSVIGIKQAVPAVACAQLISHVTRALLYWRSTDWRMAFRVLAFGCPAVILGALLFRTFSARTISLFFVILLLGSMGIRYLKDGRRLRSDPKSLIAASILWGILAGNVIGQGFLLAPFLLGTGMRRYAFVGTMATVTLVISILRVSVFGISEVLTSRLFSLGILIGVLSIPGAWAGKKLLGGLSDAVQWRIVEAMTILLIAYFFVALMSE